MKKNLFLLLMLLSVTAFSQKLQAIEIKDYTWDAEAKFNPIPAEFNSYPAVVLKDYRIFHISEFVKKSIVIKHVAIKILEAEAIGRYNKVSVGKTSIREYLDIRARVIKPDGKMIELPKNQIIEKEDSKGRQFVFEGVEVGDILEYYYTIKDTPELSGEEYFQMEIPVVDARFQMKHFHLGAMSHIFPFNGMKQTYVKGYSIYTASNLAPFKEEMSSATNVHLTKIYYLLSPVFNFSWMRYYDSLIYYAEREKAKSMVNDFITMLKLNDASVSLDERLKKMDIYLKENLEIADQDNYKKILDNKKISPQMVLNLYKDVLDELKVPYQFIISTNRFDDKFDLEQPVPTALSEVMIYIPETKKYLSPFKYWMPYGLPLYATINNDAIYYYIVDDDDVRYEFTKISNVSMNDNIDRSESEITIDDDFANVSVKKKNTLTGYPSYHYRDALKNMPQEEQKKLVEGLLFNETSITLKKYTFENTGYKFNYEQDQPLTLNAEAEIRESWVENAGSNYLIAIGKVLGKQPNLYQETERTLPIDLNYPKKILHVIAFNIPKGYQVKNTDNLKFNNELKDDKGEVIGKFTSDISINNQKVVVNIEEFYNFTHMEKNRYPEYRNLINTAFDFYKATLILSKI